MERISPSEFYQHLEIPEYPMLSIVWENDGCWDECESFELGDQTKLLDRANEVKNESNDAYDKIFVCLEYGENDYAIFYTIYRNEERLMSRNIDFEC